MKMADPISLEENWRYIKDSLHKILNKKIDQEFSSKEFCKRVYTVVEQQHGERLYADFIELLQHHYASKASF